MRLLRAFSLAVACACAIALAICLVEPRMVGVQHLASGREGPVAMPWTFEEAGTGHRLALDVHTSWLTPRRWTFYPDDGLRAVRIDGRDVPLGRVRAAALGDFVVGFTLDLSEWLPDGDHRLELILDNGGGPGGVVIRPLLGWRWMVIAAGFVPWVLLLSAWFRLRRAQIVILVAALAPLCGYLVATAWNVRAHDVPGDGRHVAYVTFLAEHLALPRPDAGWTFYHPPLYYVLGASTWRATQWLGRPALEGLQLLSLSLWLVFLAASAGALRLTLHRSPRSLAVATVALAFWPAGIMNAVSVGNDSTLYAAAAVATWFLHRWWRSGRRAHLMGMAAFVALALLAKSNALVLVVAASALVALRLWRRARWRSARAWAAPRMAALVMLGGLLASFATRIYYYLHGDIANWMIGNIQKLPAALRVPLTPLTFVPLDLRAFVRSPWVDPFDDATGRANFWNYLLRSSLSGEFYFGETVQRVVCWTWGVLLLGLMALILRPRHSLRWTASSAWRDAPWLVLAVLWLASLAALRVEAPYACSNDFRYILPILVPFLIACARAGVVAHVLMSGIALGTVVLVASL